MRTRFFGPMLALALLAGACGSGTSVSRTTESSTPATLSGGATLSAAAPQGTPSGLAQAGAAAPHGSGGSSTGSGTPVAASTGLTIFDGGLASHWQNWSWDATTNLDVKSPAYAGAPSASFTVTTPWDGFYLHTDVAVDTTPYTYLRFAAQVTQPGQRYAVVLVDTNDRFIGSPTFISQYGDITAGSWKTYQIPLSDLSGSNRQIKGIVFQDGLGHTQPPLYLDDIGLQ